MFNHKFSRVKAILKRIPLFWLLQLSGWTGYLIVVVMAILPSQASDLRVFFIVAFVCDFGASFVLRSVCRRQWQAGLRFPRSLLVVFAWCAAFAYVTATVGLVATESSTRLLTSWAHLPQLTAYAVRGGFVLLSWCALYFGIKYYETLQAERRRTLVAESSARGAELRALRYQIHPHFLFNTLNAISTLVLAGRAEVAILMIARLSDFLRTTLEGNAAHEVPLSNEIFFTEQYLEIEKLRFGDRLNVKMEVETSISDCLVPYLILQPLVENAIRHGLAPRRGTGHLRIEAKKLNGTLVIRVDDDGLGRTFRPDSTGGNRSRVGLPNIERRIKELYGEQARFGLTWPDEGGCHVLLEIPCHPNVKPATEHVEI